jgi:type I restriction enzyme S subunit
MGGGVRQSIGYSDLKWVPIILPPLDEQKRISDSLDKSTVLIDRTIAKLKVQLGKLKEYRLSLIYATVTGKIKV